MKELVDNTPIENDEIFFYGNSPYEAEFDETYTFYQANLECHSHYGIDPSFVFFNKNSTINAWASNYENYYIISFNKGLVLSQIQMFNEKYTLLDGKGTKPFAEFEKLLDSPINVLMYQNVSHFTFYHEMAHLVQKSDLLEQKLFEHLENKDGYSERRHLLELDADEYSSISIGAHILQYAEKMFGDDLKKEELEMLLIIACSSAFLYFLSYRSNIRDIYYEKFTHPHPVIRIMWIVFTIVGYCTRSLEAKGIHINLNGRVVVDKVFDFCEKISSHFFQEDLISDFKSSLQAEAPRILAYLTKFQGLKENDNSLALYKWNVNAKKIQAGTSKDTG